MGVENARRQRGQAARRARRGRAIMRGGRKLKMKTNALKRLAAWMLRSRGLCYLVSPVPASPPGCCALCPANVQDAECRQRRHAEWERQAEQTLQKYVSLVRRGHEVVILFPPGGGVDEAPRR